MYFLIDQKRFILQSDRIPIFCCLSYHLVEKKMRGTPSLCKINRVEKKISLKWQLEQQKSTKLTFKLIKNCN